MEVAGYIRVSTERQKKEGSHENQREKLEQWAEREGHSITLFENIAISAQSNDRPAYEQMMDHAEAFDAIVVRELSRFGRPFHHCRGGSGSTATARCRTPRCRSRAIQ